MMRESKMETEDGLRSSPTMVSRSPQQRASGSTRSSLLRVAGETRHTRLSAPDISSVVLKAASPNRMLAFNLPNARKREVTEYLEQCALRAKVKLMVAHMREMALAEQTEEEKEEEKGGEEQTPTPNYETLLKSFADIEPPPLAQHWIDNITKILSPKLVYKHSAMIKLIISEIHQEYQTDLLQLSIYMKFAPIFEEQRTQFLVPLKSDIGGKTPNYNMFLACRRVIENQLFLTHPLIRKILSSSKLAIPEVLVNMTNYRKRGWLHLDKLVSLIQSDMKRGEHQICKNWYPKLINMISVKNSLETVPRELWPRFVKCASTVVSVQITQLMQRSISHIIETLSDVNTFPQLSLDAYYAGNSIAMIPSEDEIFTSFHRIIDTISYMAQDMPAMEAWFAVPCPNKFISVKRSESFVRSSHEILEHNLYDIFTPVRDYLKALGEEFQGLSSEKQYLEIQTFLKERHTYEEMFENVSHIKTYSRKIKGMVYKEYFPVMRLSQTDVISFLTKISNGFMSQILQEITSQQINENKQICREFEIVAERTLHMPVKTKELVAMGSYIKYCRTTFMEKAEGRILESVRLSLRLVDFAGLSEEQLRLNTSVVNWLKKIKPIFSEYSDLFENTKYELEERLQRATEKLNKDLEDVGPSLTSLSNMDDVTKIADYVQFIQKFLRNLEQFDSIVSWINNEEVLFKFPISTYPELDELKSIVHPFTKLIFTCNKWFRTYKIWMDGAFDELVLEKVEEQVTYFFQDLTATQKTYKTKCKQQATDNYLRRFKGVVDDPDVNNWPAPLKLSSQTLNHINEFKRHLRLIGIVCNSALRERHWRDLSAVAGFDVTPDAGTTLRKFIAYHLEHLLDTFEVVSVSACKELRLHQTLCDMKAEWTDICFTSTLLDDKTVVLCDVEDVLTLVDNHSIKCVSIRGSAFVRPLIEEVKDWCDKLERINLTIETWLKVEKQWLDFHPIFTCESIRGQMDAEVILYQEVNQLYCGLMKEVGLGMPVVPVAGSPPLLSSLQHMLDILENINAGVKIYLNRLQLYFPRMFFLSDTELLEMIAETKSTDIIHLHLGKIFMGIHDLLYETDSSDVLGMKNADGEIIQFEHSLKTKLFGGSAEKLLSEVEKQMKSTMKVQCKKCLYAYKKEKFSEWVLNWPGQAIQCALSTVRTGQIHNCLSQDNSQQLRFTFNTIRNQRDTLFGLVQQNLDAKVRVVLEALIVLTVHVLDFMQLLLNNNIVSVSDFTWIVQLRYYQEESLQVKMLSASVPYGYEYLGNMSRLVVTPLTERCFRTLVGAYQLRLHGAPEGPPETGKTETVRDLARAVAVYCFSFCCVSSLKHTAIGKFLQGIAGCGAWGCLNDIHKVQLPVLSVVAQQLVSVTLAVRAQAGWFMLDGVNSPVNPHCYICVTLLPGLSVQSPIPDNLKILFRPVAMMFPDIRIIAEVCLYASGFNDSKNLALKLVSLQTLCSKQFSHQGRFCYDFGSLKAVLKSASGLKQSGHYTSEDGVLLQAVADTFNPKLTEENIRVLNSTLSELFPNSQVSFARSYSELNSQAIQICKENNLQSEDKFLLKITQIHDAMSVYTGVILVGEPFSGKTSGLNVVKSILKQSAEGSNDMEIISINPKTLSIHQMYGYADSKSNEWVDGIIPKFFREQKSRQWLRLDGPMDSDWLDILNTAFDTTHRLCLSSGEIIPISQEISVVFETLHLNEASPATVSRCGVVHLPLDTIGWRNLVRSWYSSPAEYHTGYSTNYTTLFGWIFPPTIEFIEKRGDIVMKAGRYNMVRTVLLLIEIMLRDACADNEDYVKHLAVWIQPAILLAGVWGFGGSLAPDSREQFDAFFRDLWKGNIEGHPMPDTIEKLEINIPSEGQLNDYWYHFKGKGAWRFWPEVVRSLKIEEDMPNLQFTMVTTIESAKYLNILDMHIKNQKPLLLVGPTATGKTFYINKVMSKLPLDKYLPITILFSPKTSCCLFQEFVISRLERKTKKMYRASTDRSAVLFVDDMNLCAEDAVGAQPPVEVIHQYLDHGQWLRPKHNGLVAVRDLLVWAACSSPGGNRNTVCPRTLRHFSLFAVSPLGDETVSKIYSTLLFTGFKRNGFATDVMPTVLCIVAATGDMLQWACQTLRPTPTKPHYAFSLRDYAKIIHSHLLVKRENIDSKKVFIRLWVHEALRVFSDRLIDAEDRHQVIHRLRFAVKEYFKDSFDTSLDNLMPKGQEEIQEDNLRNLVFTTALTPENSEDMRYEEVGSLDQLLKALTLIIETYNSTQTQQINIVLFRFALEHLSRLCRVMSISGGCCMLLGMRGSGRQTIAQLATILCKASFFKPTIVHNYGFSEWRSDLKKVLIQAGGKNMKSVFFVSECELKNDLFLQDISMILSTGNVPDMFSFSETEEIFELVRLSAQGGNRNLDINPLTVFAFFVSRCRHNLHVVLSLSSISYSFRRWISLYPALLNYCTIDWVEPYKSMTFNGKEYKLKDWPEEALEKIAFHYWEGLEIPETIINSAVNLCKYIHITARDATEHFHSVSGRKCYVTSASYLTMVHKFKSLVLKKQEEIQNKKANFVCGLERLEYAASQVLVIQRELEALQPQLQVASAETERMMAVIDKETDTIEQASGYVREDEKIAKTQAAAANNLKTECEADLALAIPILEEAVAALNTLKPTDITLVKSMKNPPDTVKLVMAAVCVMKDIKPEKIPDPNTPGRKILDYWGPSKRLLGDMAFLQQLKDYDKDNILPPIMSMIRKQYLPNKDFKPHIVAKASSAAEGLCKWVIAMDMYDAVAKEVAPKKAKLEIAEREFAATMAILEEKRAQVRMLEEKLMELHAKLDAAQQRKQVLEGKVSFCENRLWKAQRLIEGLSEEKQRWIEATDSLQSCYNNLPGDILLCCGLIAYLAPLTAQFRENLMSDWCQICVDLKIPMSNGFSFTKVLGFDMSIHSWTIYGLPKDMFSIENAVILESTDRCPLLIDPQGHASNWIKAKEKVNGLQVIRLSDEDYLKTLEMSLTTGIPILVENVEEDLDSIILSPLFVVSGNTQDISGKKRNIFITTRLQNPIFTPVVFNNFSVVNFTLTLSGLENKLLDIVVAKERPDLQEKKRALIVSSSQNKIKLQEVEVRILNTLQFTKGNILENESAIEVLDTAKALSADIKENQSKSIIIEDEIHSYCKQYSYVIGHTARLYFCLTSLVNMNYMYQFSLDWYLKTYTISIDTANKSQIMDIRLKYLEQRITYNLFSSVSCALFEKHRIIFALLLCTTIDLANKSIQEDDLEFLLSGKIKLEEEIPENSAQDWLPLDAWKEICHLKKLPAFSRFVDSFVVNHLEWKELQLQKSLCFPAPWDFKLSSFQKLIIIKIIYPDHMTEWILKYVEEQMGREYANPSSFNLNSCFEDSNCLTPLLLILSPGADPATALFQFARKKQFHNRFHSISLGVGQGESACRMVEGCRREGNWAVLLNCHLAPDYMASLERLCDSVTLLNTSMEFRLWLTCAPTTQLPMSILQSSVKMTTDLPSGLKTRLIHCYQSEPLYDDRFFYSCPGKDREFAKLLYSLSFFHSMLQERKKYRHIGWNVPYQFTEVDYHISLRQLQMYINQNKDIPYDMIQYVIGECNYGGLVYDFWDRRLLTSLVADLVSQRVADTPDCQLFPAPPDPRFQVPLRFEYHDFIVAIENIPDKCTAEVFGLNYNAEILHNLEVTQEIIEIISEMQPNNFKRNNSIKASTLDTVELIIKKLPQTKEIISESDISNTGLGLVLQQEYKLYSTLLTVIHSSLLSFRAAFLGLGQAKDDFEQFGAQIEDNLVPSSWINVSYDTCKSLGSYIDDFVRRLEYLKECSLTGYQQDVWLPGLFCPQALLVAVLHEHARLSSTPFHLLSFHHTVLADSDLHSADPGIVVNGLYIQGARWNHSLNSLEEQPPREFFSAMPRVWFRPSEGEVGKEGEARYRCPLYSTVHRLNFIADVSLPATRPSGSSHWVYRGVALLSQVE